MSDNILLLCSTKIHYRAHKSPSYVYTLSKFNPIYTIKCYLRSILVISSLLHKPRSLAWNFSLSSLNKNFYASLISSVNTTFGLITLIILDEEYKLWSFAIYNFLSTYVASFFLWSENSLHHFVFIRSSKNFQKLRQSPLSTSTTKVTLTKW